MKRKRDDLKVPVEKLRYNCDPEKLNFKDTSTVEPLKDFIGQDRAIKSLEFGLGIKAPGYNIFVTGLVNTGRTSVICKYLQDHVEKKKTDHLKDLCYAYNFVNPEQPKLLIFNKGEGQPFKAQMSELAASLKTKIPEIFTSEAHLKEINKIDIDLQTQMILLKMDLDMRAKEKGFIIRNSGKGLEILPVSAQNNDQPMSEEEFQKLTLAQKAEIAKKKREIWPLIAKFNSVAGQLDKEARAKMKEQEEKSVAAALKSIFSQFQYQDKNVIAYLRELESWVSENIDLFIPKENPLQALMPMTQINGNGNGNGLLLPFEVNVCVDNSRAETVPIILENYPSFSNLFGKIERSLVRGGYVTDHTQIKAGSLLTANGGYLVLNAYDLLTNPGVWEKLKKTLEAGLLKVEDVYEYFGYHSTTLDPDPIPIDLKVIVICSPWLYYALTIYDPDFINVFKVRAEFDSQIDLNSGNFKNYAAFISLCCQEGDLLPFDKGAVAKIIEYSVRLVEDQKKLSTKFGQIKDIVQEANYWAKKDKARKVKAAHVQKAIDDKRERGGLMEDHYQEYITRDILMVDTDGEKVGQINGLAVLGADPPFGLPEKITVQIYAGDLGIVNIQRQVGLAGPIHNTGLEILSSFLRATYAQDEKISLAISLCFEQNYGKIEGDSATAAEFSVIISGLAGVAIDQSLAITGSMNQRGEIQPIGGVNEKIEGFFDICRARGLTGKQGVIIPCRNVENLALREDVVEAVKKGQFSIYAVKFVNEAIEILTNREMREINDLVNKRLEKSRKKDKKNKKDANESESEKPAEPTEKK